MEDQFADRLASVADLSDDELRSLEEEIVAAFDAADQQGDVENMTQLAEHIDTVRAEIARREEDDAVQEEAVPEAAPAEPVPAMASAAVTEEAPAAAEAPTEPTEPAAETVETTAEVTEPETPAETEATAQPSEESTPAEPVAETESEAIEVKDEAAAEAPAPTESASTEEEEMPDVELTAADAPAAEAQETEQAVQAATPPMVIRAGGDIPGVSAGSELDGDAAIAEALTARINSLRGTGGNGEQVVVASIEIPDSVRDDERTLRPGDTEGNARKLRQLREAPEALTAAANGWCAPRTPMYDIPGVGTNERPVQASLPGFNAERGGITWTAPPVLADAGYGVGKWNWIAGGTNDWRGSSTTADGALTSKVLFEPSCPGELSADLYAVTTQLKFNTLTARAFPEMVRRNMELAQVAHARFAESLLLGKMWAAADDATSDIPTPALGAVRDALVLLRVIAASLRARHRVDPDSQVDLWAPAWFREAMILDLNAQAPGDDKLGVAKSEVDGYIADAGINVTWHLDEVPGADVAQVPATATALPTHAALIMALPGSYLYLDGGSLDLGVVRDGDLVGTNKYIEFSETFEGLAFVGLEAIKMNLPVKVIGGYAAAVNTSAGIVLDDGV